MSKATAVKAPAKEESKVITSYSLDRKEGHWAVVTIKTQDKQIISIEYGEPNPKAIAIEEFKIKVARTLMVDGD